MQHDVQSLNDLLVIARRRKWSIVVPAAAIFGIAALLALLLPSEYRSTSTILIEEQEIPREYVTATVSTYAEQRLQSISQRIMSTSRLLEIINRFNLYGDLRSRKPMEEIVEKMRKDIVFQTVSADVVDPRTGRPTAATIAFTLSYAGKNPASIQQVTNVLASLYLEENLRVREQQTLGTTKFLDDETRQVQAALAVVESRIAAYKERNINALPELAQFNMQGLDRVEFEVDRLTEQQRMLREREGYLQSELATIPADTASQDKARLSELRAKLVNLRTRFSDEYPDVQKAKREITELERQFRGGEAAGKPDNPAYVTLSAQLASVKVEIEGVKRQLVTLQGRRDGLRKRIEASPRVEEGYKVLLADRDNLRAKFDELTKKYMEAKVAHGLEKGQMGERFTIIDAARLPEKPISPNRPAILLIGLILGLGAGIGTAAIREHGDKAVHSAELLERLTNIPVLASIPTIAGPDEEGRGGVRLRILLSGATASVVTLFLIVHFFVMDLDIVWAKILRRINF